MYWSFVWVYKSTIYSWTGRHSVYVCESESESEWVYMRAVHVTGINVQ